MHTSDFYDEIADSASQDVSGGVAATLADAPAVILYGAGGAGRDVLRVLLARGITVRCFLDRGALPGAEHGGIPIRLPDDPSLGPETRSSVPVIVAVFNPQVDSVVIEEDLHRLGWAKVLPFVKFHRAFAADLGSRYWLTEPGFYKGRAPQMRAASALWEDGRSRAIYDAVLRYRQTGKNDPVLLPDTDSSYFPDDVPPWQAPARFVDCGAYDGDTLRQIRERRFPLDAVAAFEPDPAHLPALSTALREAAASRTAEALLWPCAVHSATERLRFATGLGMASSLRAEGQETVQAVALDDVLAGFRPTLIKMDIEGAEYDALLGARETVRRCRPGLAICVYHRPQHLWQIAMLIHSWNLGYRFWLRAHGHNGYDLVLYAQADRNDRQER